MKRILWFIRQIEMEEEEAIFRPKLLSRSSAYGKSAESKICINVADKSLEA